MQCLLVEDERQSREGMVALVPWRELGFDKVLTAANGLEALSVIDAAAPDLIISDVRMPRMNGVQLLKELRDTGRDMPFLFLSGFSDKEYLMTAIRYHAVDYLEKPIIMPEFIERLRAIVAGMHAPRNWLTARALLDEGATLPPLFQGARRFYVALLSLAADGLALTRQQVDCEIRAFHKMVVQEQETPERTLLIIAEGDDKIDFERLIAALNNAGGGYSLCVSQSAEDFAMLPQAYKEADACASHAYMGPLRGLHVYALAPEKLRALLDAAPNDMRRLIARKLYSLLPELAQFYMDELSTLDVGRAEALEFLGALVRSLGGLDMTDISRQVDYRAASIETRRQIEAFSARKLAQGMNPIVGRTILRVAEDLRASYSVSELAHAAFVSASHMSFLFKQDTGVPIKQYINDMRIESAKLLLRRGGSVHEVAASVGIADVMYFSKLFKRETGIAPSEYR